MPANQTTATLSPEEASRIEALRPLAVALPAEAISPPEIPVSVYIDEGLGYLAAAREHERALLDVGMPEELIGALDTRLLGLQALQTLWNREQDKDRSEGTIKLIDQAKQERAEGLAEADLALRANQEGQRRLSNIREGEGLPDLVADLLDLALLFTDASALFGAIRLDAKERAKALEKAGKGLQGALSKEDAQKSLSTTKELRDRFYTLTIEPLRELRAFAAFAFRKDKGNNRRAAFISAYARRVSRRSRARHAAVAVAAAAAVTPLEG